MIGNGNASSLVVSGVSGEPALTAGLVARFGANLLGLWLPSGISAGVANWTAAYAGGNLTNSTANRFDETAINGRRAITSTVAVAKSLTNVTLSAPPLSVWAVLSAPAGTPTDYDVAVRVGPEATGSHPIVITGGTTNYYTGSGWTHYRNGAAQEAITTDLAVIEGVNATNSYPDVIVGGLSVTATRSWRGKIEALLFLAAIPSAGDRTATVADFRVFAGI